MLQYPTPHCADFVAATLVQLNTALVIHLWRRHHPGRVFFGSSGRRSRPVWAVASLKAKLLLLLDRVRPCLVVRKFQKFYKIFHHIKSLEVYMKY
jgi:hypothetical protein